MQQPAYCVKRASVNDYCFNQANDNNNYESV